MQRREEPREVSGGPSTDEIELGLLLDGVRRKWEVDLRDFPRPVLRERLFTFLRGEGLRTYSALQDLVLHDGAAFERMLLSLSLRTASMFGDTALHLAFRKTIAPRLRTYVSPNVWLAGCGTGEEAWALAIAAREEGLLPKLRIYATDTSESVLASARHGVVPSVELPRYERNYRRAGGAGSLAAHWIAAEGTALLDPDLRSALVFSVHDFATDGSFNELCFASVRQGIAGLPPEIAAKAWDVLRESLVPFGFLALATGELRADTPVPAGFELVEPELPLLRRIP